MADPPPANPPPAKPPSGPLIADDPELPPGGTPAGDDLPWQAWSPAEIAQRLATVSVPWCVAAGWALDLFRGETTREHEDLEIAVPAAGFPAIRAVLPELEWQAAGSGQLFPVDHAAFDLTHQTWGRSQDSGLYRIDVFREPHEGRTWICRRDPAIRRPYETLISRSRDGIPYLAPEVVLLFKAKSSRPKDLQDFLGALPLLTPQARDWLAATLLRVHPGHAWLTMLD
jgi:hypothetical protein